MSITRLVELLTGTNRAIQRKHEEEALDKSFAEQIAERRAEFERMHVTEEKAEESLAHLPKYRLDPRIDGKYQVYKRRRGRTAYEAFGKPMDYSEARQAIKNLSRPPIFLTETGERMKWPEPEI